MGPIEKGDGALAIENGILTRGGAVKGKRPLLLGSSAAMEAVRYFIDQVAASTATCLITGPSGSGKEIAARTLHALSDRANGPMISVNCGAIPAELIESELFGHEKGAFTGAAGTRIGRFEAAHGGTIFLDEIGDMPLEMQVKLLRVLEERRFERVGGNKSIAVDVRVVAATHRDLQERIADGSFREDLFYRLNIFPIHLPSLQARRDDVPELAAHFAAEFGNGSPAFALSPSALEALVAYDWPGNVRELRNWAERASVLYRGKEVDAAGTQFLLSLGRMRAQIDAGEAVTPLARSAEQVPAMPASVPAVPTMPAAPNNVTALPFLKDRAPEAVAVAAQRTMDVTTNEAAPMPRAEEMLGSGKVNLKKILQDLEVEFIESALIRTGHTVSEAAKMLGLQRTTLCEKMRKYGFERKDALQQASATA